MRQPSEWISSTVDLGQTPTISGAHIIRDKIAPKILVFADWYLPGRKAGGSVSAIANLIELLKGEFRFSVITRDRDIGEKSPYAGISANQWLSVGSARVLYTSDISFANLTRWTLDVDPDLIYLNSFFSPLTRRVLLLRGLGLLGKSAVVLAPRGELSPGALRLKRLRKSLYRNAALRAGLCRNVTWQASSKLEKQHLESAGIVNRTVNAGHVFVAADTPGAHLSECPVELRPCPKKTGAVRLVFLSRISRIKNLDFALKVLAPLRGHVEFEIVGPVEDARYWAECRHQIRDLPENIVVRRTGPVQHEHVRGTFLQHQFLLLPTLGENFGYIILEALAAGCPVLISDQTPWRNLQDVGAGWDLPLARFDLWQRALLECVAMDDESYRRMSQQARCFAQTWLASASFHRDTADLFGSALACTAIS